MGGYGGAAQVPGSPAPTGPAPGYAGTPAPQAGGAPVAAGYGVQATGYGGAVTTAAVGQQVLTRERTLPEVVLDMIDIFLGHVDRIQNVNDPHYESGERTQVLLPQVPPD